MRNNFRRLSLLLFVALFVCAIVAAAAPQTLAAGRARQLGTVTGSVHDQYGNPLAGALVQFLRDGANQVVKQTRSAADGRFTARLAPGRYLLSAVAEGFNSATFNSVQVNPSAELIYRFNLEPLGEGRTAPEQRKDRNDPKWRLRAAQSHRSIFQNNEGHDEVAEAVQAAIDNADEAQSEETDPATPAIDDKAGHPHGVIETYTSASANAFSPFVVGTNFAVSTPVSDQLNLIFAGQVASNSLARLETTGQLRVNARHRVSITLGGATLPLISKPTAKGSKSLDQISMRAVDEWIVRDGVIVVLGLDYSRFMNTKGDASISPRIGFRMDANARTRVQFAYAPGSTSAGAQSSADFEGNSVIFPETSAQPVAFVGDGRAVMERSRRLEFGVERVLDNKSSVEATAFFDTTDGRGVGLMNLPLNGFSETNGAQLLSVANQQGAARGMRVVYVRRLSRFIKTSAGYSFGRGQELAPNAATAAPNQMFRDGFFQTVAAQVDSDLDSGTHIRTVLHFSPRASVFAIDPFAGRLAVFDPSLSILVTQDLPTFGLPLRAEAVIDARNLLDTQTGVDDGETFTFINNTRRSVRGGISVRF